MIEPKLLAQSNDLTGEDNFPAGCSLSPDGLCLLTWTAADSLLRIYNTLIPRKEGDESDEVLLSWKTALSCHGGNAVRSYSWYPHMKSSDPASCCFLAAARNQPVHLYDAYTGSVRASYRPYNALDEMESAVVACFHPSGTQLVASGFRSDRTLHVFDTAVPGRESTVWRLGKTRRSSDGQKGLVSSLAYAPDGKYVAVGTYAPASIYVYDHRSGSTPSGTVLDGTCVVGHGRSHARKKRRLAAVSDPADPEDEDDAPPTWLSSAKVKWFHKKAQGGITHLQFSPTQEYLLYSVSRRSNTVLTWDLRMLSDDPDCKSHAIGGIASYETDNDTNQRLEFDLDDTGSRLFVGGRDRCVRVYSTESGELQGRIGGLDGPASGVSIRRNPSSASGSSFLAIASGARRFLSEEELDGEDAALPSNGPPGALRLFQVGDGSSGDIDDNSSPLDNSDEGRLDCAQ